MAAEQSGGKSLSSRGPASAEWRKKREAARKAERAYRQQQLAPHTTVSEIKSEFVSGAQRLWHGAGDILHGHIASGVVETVGGLSRETDMLALGIGALALGTLVQPFVLRKVNKQHKSFGEAEREAGHILANPTLARAVGYTVIALSVGTGLYLRQSGS